MFYTKCKKNWHHFPISRFMNFDNTACEKNVEKYQLDLVCQLQLRNAKAFIHLYQAYSPGVCSLIERVVSCPLASEEVMQNAFHKVWLKIGKIVCLPEGTVKTRMRMSYRKLRRYLLIAN